MAPATQLKNVPISEGPIQGVVQMDLGFAAPVRALWKLYEFF